MSTDCRDTELKRLKKALRKEAERKKRLERKLWWYTEDLKEARQVAEKITSLRDAQVLIYNLIDRMDCIFDELEAEGLHITERS